MGKLMSPNTRIDWIEASAYDPLLPSAALFSDATNISCAIESGYTLNPTKSDVNTKKSICEDANVETPVRYNYEGNLTFFREGDLADTTSAFAIAFAFFGTVRKTGYLVRRTGLRSTVAIAAAQKVDSFKFTSDFPQDVIDDDLIEFSTKFLPQGRMELDKAVVA
jgi:hypothetical protein